MDQQTKVAGSGLEDIMDWMSIIANEPAKEEEMSRLAAGFATLMHKRAAGSEGESTLCLMGNIQSGLC